MKLSGSLLEQVTKKRYMSNVLDIGCGYPYELIELIHNFDVLTCHGVELKGYRDLVSIGFGYSNIAKYLNVESLKIHNLIDEDEDECRHFYNSYRLYVAIVLDKNPLEYSCFKNNLKLHVKTNIIDFVEKIENSLEFFDLIMAKKCLSHIGAMNQDLDKDMVLDSLISRLNNDGIIYLLLNSDDFQNETDEIHDEWHSTIKSSYTREGIERVRSKLDEISFCEKRRDSDNKLEYEIIGRRPLSPLES